MFTSLTEIVLNFGHDESAINKYKHLEDFIVQLYNDNNHNESLITGQDVSEINADKLYWIGNYFKDHSKYISMIRYYLLSIKHDNSDAMYNLGYYYQFNKKNYNEMKKYYLMAINLNNVKAMYCLGYYYQFQEKNYDEMKKYYLMAINLNNSDSMNNLAHYYQHIEINYDKMKKYYLMAINLNNKMCINYCKKNYYFYDTTIRKMILKLKHD